MLIPTDANLKPSWRQTRIVGLSMVSGLVLLYLSFTFSKGTHNTSYFIKWVSGMVNGEFFSLYHVVPFQGVMETESLTVPYPPFSLYLLGLVGGLLSWLIGEDDKSFLIASNLTSVAFTFLTFWLITTWSRKNWILSPKIFLATPSVFLISPILGYQDSIMSFFILLTLILAHRRFYFFAGSCASLAVLSKQLAMMPIFGLFVLILLTFNWRVILRAIGGFTFTSLIVLSPFILTGTITAYFRAQGLASVHTMMSAQNPNVPWLIGFFTRVKNSDVYNALRTSAVPVEIVDETLRRFLYLAFGLITVSIIVAWLVYWSRRNLTERVSPLYVGVIAISTYNLFSFGVHENHVYMLLPVLFAMSVDSELRKSYYLVSLALTLNLIATGGFGQSFFNNWSIVAVSGLAYAIVSFLCLSLYVYSYVLLLQKNPLTIRLEK